MKRSLALLILIPITFIFTSCEDDKITDPPASGTTNVSGTIENWSFSTGKTLKIGTYNGPSSFLEVGSGAIQTDGSFSITLNTPPANLLDSLTSSCEECEGGFTSTTAGVMVYGTAGGLIYQGTQVFGVTQYINRDFSGDELYIPALNDVYLELVYFSKATTFNGSQTYNDSFDGTHTTRVTRTASNITVTAGWNKLYTTVTSRTDTTAAFSMSTVNSVSLKWYRIRF